MTPQSQELTEWLKVATNKLTPPAKERIRSEIEAHYVEAVENHVKEGLSEADAQKKAVRELGDAERAARRFRQRHLIEGEAERLAKLTKRSRSTWGLLLLEAFCVTVCIWVYHFAHESHLTIGPGLVILSAMGSLLLAFTWLYGRYGTARSVINLSTASEIAMLVGAVIVLTRLNFHLSPPKAHWFCVINLLMWGIPSSIRPVRQLVLTLKLRRVTDLDHELSYLKQPAS